MFKKSRIIFSIFVVSLYLGSVSSSIWAASPQDPTPEEKRKQQESQQQRRSKEDPSDPTRHPSPIDPSQQTVRPGQPATPEQENPARTPGTPQDPSRPDIPGEPRTDLTMNNPAQCCKTLENVHAQLQQNIQAMQTSLGNLKDAADRTELQKHIDALTRMREMIQSPNMPGTGSGSASPGQVKDKNNPKKKKG